MRSYQSWIQSRHGQSGNKAGSWRRSGNRAGDKSGELQTIIMRRKPSMRLWIVLILLNTLPSLLADFLLDEHKTEFAGWLPYLPFRVSTPGPRGKNHLKQKMFQNWMTTTLAWSSRRPESHYVPGGLNLVIAPIVHQHHHGSPRRDFHGYQNFSQEGHVLFPHRRCFLLLSLTWKL